jgi:UDP-glucuronate decarboxylase
MDTHIKNICEEIYNFNSFDEFKDKTILITGANGLIGGMFSDYFSYLNEIKNYNIKLVLTSFKIKEDVKRIEHLVNKPYVTYISLDLTKEQSWGEIDNHSIDYAFYCAGYATPKKFIDQPISSFLINTLGLYNLLDFICKNNNKCKFLYISSAEVYSANKDMVHKETDNLIIDINNKRNFYKFGKISGELILSDFLNKGLNVKSIRTSVCYGPGILDDDSRVISDLSKKAFNNDVIELMDDGSAKRKYLHISDFCKMVFNITNYGKKSVYNTSGNQENTVKEIAKIISDKTDKKIKLGSTSNIISRYAPKDVMLSLSNYEDEFGVHEFKPTKDGISEFVDWYKSFLKK